MSEQKTTNDTCRVGDVIRLAGIPFRITEVLAPFRYRLEAVDE